MRFYMFTYILVFLVMASSPNILHAQDDLPDVFKKCSAVGSTSTVVVGYKDCFTDSKVDYYGRVYLKFDPPETGDVFGMTKKEKKSFFKIVKQFFLPKTKHGSIVLELKLVRPGSPPIPIEVIELASFSKDQKIIKSSSYASYLNGRVGYSFRMSGSETVVASIKYLFAKKQESQIAEAIKTVSQTLSGIGFLPRGASLSAEAMGPITKLNDLIASRFDVNDSQTIAAQLTSSDGSTSVAKIAVGLGGSERKLGSLVIGIDQVPSVLNSQAEGNATHVSYGESSFGTAATATYTSSVITGATLNNIVKKELGLSEYNALSGSDPTQFGVACSKLDQLFKDSKVDLNQDDRLAAVWAFIAQNNLLSQRSVRQGYCLSSSEASNELSRRGLPLPRLAPLPITGIFKQQLIKAQAAEAEAEIKKIAAAIEMNNALAASKVLGLPGTYDGHQRIIVDNLWVYTGQSTKADQHFLGKMKYGNILDDKNYYLGQMKMPSTFPIFDGLGKYFIVENKEADSPQHYIGEFSLNYFAGYGEMLWKNGKRFTGQFSNDLPNGYGVMQFVSGKKWSGFFIDGEPTGSGVETLPDGTMSGGNWSGGVFIPKDI